MKRGGCSVLWVLGFAACAVTPGTTAPPDHDAMVDRSGGEASSSRTTLLSAQLTRAYWDDRLDPAILLVFSRRIDAASLDPRYFSVIMDDGRRTTPSWALLAPASEADEHRTVVLTGNFTATGDGRPIHVIVSGPVYSVAGDSVQRASFTVEPLDRPLQLVAAEIMQADPGRCDGHKGVVRTYWSNVVGGVDEADLRRIALVFASGARVHPVGFDDHDVSRTGAELVEDNVLDLCFDDGRTPTALQLPRGAFADPEGRPSEPANTALSAMPRD